MKRHRNSLPQPEPRLKPTSRSRPKRNWNISRRIAAWRAVQDTLRQKLIIQPLLELPRYVAGADAAFSRDGRHVIAVALIYDRKTQETIELAHAVRPVRVPYVPGFLTFREGPAVLAAVRKLKHPFGIICFDGQGYAHPRRCGLAVHLSILLHVPGVGVAKSRLIGTYREPANAAGSASPLMDGDEQIGLVLRTRDGGRPLFVSIGHRVDLDSAARLVRACLTRYRIPEPTRRADIEVAAIKRRLA
jgi:deoxyribonuclease V